MKILIFHAFFIMLQHPNLFYLFRFCFHNLFPLLFSLFSAGLRYLSGIISYEYMSALLAPSCHT